MDFLLVLLAYLIGSINFPILAGRLRGWDIRERDLAGTSGVFRQLGSGWGVGVGVLEVGKGMLAAWLAGLSASFWAAPLCALAVVAGHIWPVWFGFRGGGGLAAAGGYALWTFPQETLWSLLVFALGLGVYFLLFKRDRFQGIGSIPFAAILAFIYLVYVLGADARALYTLLALGGHGVAGGTGAHRPMVAPLAKRGNSNFAWMVVFGRRSKAPSSRDTPGIANSVPITVRKQPVWGVVTCSRKGSRQGVHCGFDISTLS